MRRFLLDSGIASDYMNRRNGVFERADQEAARGNKIGISTPVLGELAAGAQNSASRIKNLKESRIALRTWLLWPYDEAAAMEFGRIYAALRAMGRIIQAPDMQTAAIAFALGNTTVVTNDTDFQVIPGLSLENWATP